MSYQNTQTNLPAARAEPAAAHPLESAGLPDESAGEVDSEPRPGACAAGPAPQRVRRGRPMDPGE